MARRDTKKKRQAAADEPASDLEILHPDREIQIGGQIVTVREYGFIEGLRLRAVAAPLIDGLYPLMESRSVDLERIIDLLAEHEAAVLELMAISIREPVSFIEGLGTRDGEHLMMTWWTVNGPFFVRAVQRKMQDQMVRRSMGITSTGGTSTPPLSPPATPPTASETTPSDS